MLVALLRPIMTCVGRVAKEKNLRAFLDLDMDGYWDHDEMGLGAWAIYLDLNNNATLDTGEPRDGWFFMAKMKAAGPEAMTKWRTYPIGGEIRPELWSASFTDRPDPRGQDFLECVEQTHVTWLMDTGAASALDVDS